MALSRSKPYGGLLAVLLIFLVVTVYTSWQIPLSVGPDETAHFMFARYWRQEFRLPVTEEDFERGGYKSDQPPLNSILVGSAFFWDNLDEPPFVKLTFGVPRRHLAKDGVVDPTGRSYHIVNTEDPLAGEYLFWRFGRLMSTVFSMLTLAVTYFIARKTFEDRPQKHWWALASVMVVAFIPTFIYISGVFSYENLLGLWLALYLLTAVYIIKGKESSWLFLLAGLFVGLALVTKLSALVVPASLVVLVSLVGYRSHWSAWKFSGRLAVSALGVILSAGWWFVWIESKFNRVADLGWFEGLLRPLVNDEVSTEVFYLLSHRTLGGIEPTSSEIVSNWIRYMFQTGWSFGNTDHTSVFTVLLAVSVLAVVGLLYIWWRKQESHIWLLFLGFFVAILFILPLVRLLTTGFEFKAGQGQHVLFPAAGAIAVLFVWGLSVWTPVRRDRQWLGGIVLGFGLLIWSVYLAVFVYVKPTPVPVRTVPPYMPVSARTVDIDFGPMILKGFELKGNDSDSKIKSDRPVLGVNLYWFVQELVHEDYLTTLRLVDSQGKTPSIWVGYGANGRYPSRAWEPNDILRDELYLPLAGVQPGVYTITLEIRANGKPAQLADNTAVWTLAQVDLTRLTRQPKSPVRAGQSTGLDVWFNGDNRDLLPTVQYQSTVQITAEPETMVKLVDPKGKLHDPVTMAGQTRVFIIDPLWPTGEYQLLTETVEQPDQEITSALVVNGQQREANIPASDTVVNANFANYIKLLGYDLPETQLTAGEALPVQLNWQALQTIPADFKMFVRIYDEEGTLWGGYDRWPREYYSPYMWVPGEVVEDGFTIPVDPEAPAGQYYLDVGFYLVVGQAPVSLPLMANGEFSKTTSFTIGPFTIHELQSKGGEETAIK